MILILEDNVYKIQKIVDHNYQAWANKTVLITGYELEAKRVVNRVIDELYLDYELFPGAGDGMSFLRGMTKEGCRKVFITTMNPYVAKEMAALCREKGITCERLVL